MKTLPQQAIVAITYRCNARCGMCDIWRKDHQQEVEPSYYYHLPVSLREINLTGGEPFLRDDLPKIVAVMVERLPRVRIIISSNGLLTERIQRMAPELMRLSSRLGVRISIDGDAATHDRIRGIPGAHEKAWATIEALRSAGIKDLGIGFTMMKGNEDFLLPLFDRAMSQGLQFTSTVVHSSPIFFGAHDEQWPDSVKAVAAYEGLRRRQLNTWQPKNWFRAYFTAGVRDLVGGKGRPIHCQAGRAFFYLDSYGEAFPCHIKDWPLGKLDEGYERLLAKNETILQRVTTCQEHCWMTCTVAPMMREDLFGTTVQVALDRARAAVRWY